MLPFAPAAERNKDALLAAFRPYLEDRSRLLEIGSGTGQHAVHLTGSLPHLVWQCSDLPAAVPGIAARLEAEGHVRTPPPLALDVAEAPWALPERNTAHAFDAMFTANTLHIMSIESVACFFERAGEVLADGGILGVYGPMKYAGAFTTPSNEAFDRQLKDGNPESGIRDFETLDRLAEKQGFGLVNDIAMPANNQLLIWRRHGPAASV